MAPPFSAVLGGNFLLTRGRGDDRRPRAARAAVPPTRARTGPFGTPAQMLSRPVSVHAWTRDLCQILREVCFCKKKNVTLYIVRIALHEV